MWYSFQRMCVSASGGAYIVLIFCGGLARGGVADTVPSYRLNVAVGSPWYIDQRHLDCSLFPVGPVHVLFVDVLQRKRIVQTAERLAGKHAHRLLVLRFHIVVVNAPHHVDFASAVLHLLHDFAACQIFLVLQAYGFSHQLKSVRFLLGESESVILGGALGLRREYVSGKVSRHESSLYRVVGAYIGRD